MPKPQTYDAVSGVAEAEINAKGSRFIGIVAPCPSVESLKAILADVMERYPGATHYCYGAVIGPDMDQKSSDNGEPSGTAGRPITDVIRGEGLSDTACVVVRYFGGTLLGTGGLVRAYSGTARDTVVKAPRETLVLCDVFDVSVAYDELNVLEHACGDLFFSCDREFTERVRLKVAVRQNSSEEFEARAVRAVYKAKVQRSGQGYFKEQNRRS
jgi:uncharacterized YigZ family protein